MSAAAVIEGKLQHVSASQITTYEACPTQWYAQKVMRWPEPPNPSFELGTMIHGQMEDYYDKGKVPLYLSAKKLVETGKLPARTTTALIEHPRNYELGLKLAGIRLKGRADLLDLSGIPRRHVDVWDWKSSSNIAYAKDTEALNHNTQLIIYDEYAFRTYDIDTVRNWHGNIDTSAALGACSITKSDALDRAHVREHFEALNAVVERMAITATAKNIEDVPGNLQHCRAYNKLCPFALKCPTFAAAHVVTHTYETEPTQEETMDLAAKLAARRAATSTTPAPELGTTTVTTEPVAEAPAKVRATGINPPDAAPVVIPAPYVPTVRVSTPAVYIPSRRDYFAAAAITGLVMDSGWREEHSANTARLAYGLADAMVNPAPEPS